MNPFRIKDPSIVDQSSGQDQGQENFQSNINDLTDSMRHMDVNMADSRTNLTTIRQHDNRDQHHLMDYNTNTTAYDRTIMGQRMNETPRPNSNSIIVTNLDPIIFKDENIKSDFAMLFLRYDNNLNFTFLKSFNRVRIDFSSEDMAKLVRSEMDNYEFYGKRFHCFPLQNICKKPASNNLSNDNNNDNQFRPISDKSSTTSKDYLKLPKLTKQFLISPPASPPTDWEPSHEGPPVIDVQLISAIANLVPGKVHEIHPGNESHPSIFVEVCEQTPTVFETPTITTCNSDNEETDMDMEYFRAPTGQRPIPRTPCPGSY